MTARRYPLPDLPRTVLVTGAARRIGRVIARRLAADGWAVALHYNGSAEAARETVAAIAAAGGRADTFHADLAIEAESQALIDQVTASLGPVGARVDNASTSSSTTCASPIARAGTCTWRSTCGRLWY